MPAMESAFSAYSQLPIDHNVTRISPSSNESVDTNHSNVFVRGLPLTWAEQEIMTVFQQYGMVTSLRLVRHSATKHSLGYGFVRFQSIPEAQAAIQALDGSSLLGHVLQVKLADSDAGPPNSGNSSGLTPSDSVYVKHLPATCSAHDAILMFETFGPVLDVKLFPCLDHFRGGSALIRMASIEAADRAIAGLNGSMPTGAAQALIVRYAESATEKAARLNRREQQMARQTTTMMSGILPAVVATASTNFGGVPLPSSSVTPLSTNAVVATQIQQALAALGLNGSSAPPLTTTTVPSLVSQPLQSGVQPPSICIMGVPPSADRLWVYEHFARFGPLTGMHLMMEKGTTLCAGTAYVTYGDEFGAENAVAAMHGCHVEDGRTVLSVCLQKPMPLPAGLL